MAAVGYEVQGNQAIPLNGSSQGVGSNRINKKYTAILILFIVVIISAISVVFLANGGKRCTRQPAGREVLDFAQIVAADNVYHTHPKSDRPL